MARKNANAAKGITRGKRYRRYAPHQYGALQSSIWGTKLVRILRPTPGGFLVELPDGRAVRAMASEVLL